MHSRQSQNTYLTRTQVHFYGRCVGAGHKQGEIFGTLLVREAGRKIENTADSTRLADSVELTRDLDQSDGTTALRGDSYSIPLQYQPGWRHVQKLCGDPKDFVFQVDRCLGDSAADEKS